MTLIDRETKQKIVNKAFSRREGKTLSSIAAENNVSLSALSKWMQQARKQGHSTICQDKKRRTPLEHLLMTANLKEEKIGAYCREQGIYSFQLKEWNNKLMDFKEDQTITPKERLELKALRSENKKLKKDLTRKEKALAETSALLILKKKADLIWGDPEAN